ncbi:putative non-specific serine/threonine protein kinase [Helianthus annuus]|nr:putative non-specific serine/threonine protein kinase [Helianthus annuus]
MGNQWCLGLQFIIVTSIMVVTTNTCLGARNINSMVACFEHERLALLKFKQSVRDATNMLSSWVGNDSCRWERVMCDGVTGHVDSLHLEGDFYSRERLVGKELSTSLGELRHLKYLNLGLNNFQGSQIGNLSNLKILDLSTYTIYDELMSQDTNWISGLSSLEHIDLSSVNLTGLKILDVVLYMAPSVKVLSLSDCGLLIDDSGPLRNLSTTLSNIKYLDLSWNIFTAPLVILLPKETHLYHILHNLTTLSNIQHVDLSRNGLTDSIPETIGRLAALTTFSVNHNKLSGTIPVSIWQLSKLRSLDVSYNSLEGEIYESHLANLLMLKEFNVGSNSKLTLNVSREWLPPFQLRDIDLSSCKIGNGFPRWLRNQRKLHSLVLSNTSISGPLPTWLRKMPIPFMDLSHNNLSGPLTNLPNFPSCLFLQNNIFNQSIPRSLCKRIDLQILDLSRNRLTGKIPNCFQNLQNLEFMKSSSNELHGVISSFIGNISLLQFLKLNDNNFNGELPPEIWNLSRLWVLDLGDNSYTEKYQNGLELKLNQCRFLDYTTITSPEEFLHLCAQILGFKFWMLHTTT